MGKIKNIILSIKDNWKAMLFAVVYVACFFMMIAWSFEITKKVKGTNYAIFSPLLLCIALLSALSLITKLILHLAFKEEANQIARKPSIVFIPIGIFVAISAILNLSSTVPIPFDTRSELGIFTSLFAIPAYFILLIMTGMFLLLVSFIAFALLRFLIAHTKAMIIIFLLSSLLWFASLGNIYLPVNIHIGNINNPQITFQDILSMNLRGSSFQITSTFFIYNEKIYAYVFQNPNYNNSGDEFFVVDLQGKSKKVISNSDEMRLAQFLHIDNNEAYYYTMFKDSINKINLETGDISVVFKFEESFFATEYEKARQKLYEINPEFQKAIYGDYKIEDDYYLYSYYPRTVTVKNIKTNKTTECKDTIYWNIEDSVLYLLRGEEEDTGIYDYSNIKNIRVDKIILE